MLTVTVQNYFVIIIWGHLYRMLLALMLYVFIFMHSEINR